MTDAITIENVCKRFKKTVALDQVSFTVRRGTIFGLLGPNGAGKTTLMRILVGILGPDEGRVQMQPGEGRGLKESLGYLPEDRGLYPKMKVKRLIEFFASLKGVPRSEMETRIKAGLVKVGLAGQENKKVTELSKGNQQRVQLLITLLHEPEYLILDEPFTGLDPIGVDQMKAVLIEAAQRGATVMISTHRMEDAEQLCEGIALIHRGRVVESGSLAAIKQARGQSELEVEYEGDPESIASIQGFEITAVADHVLRGRLARDANVPVVCRELAERLDVFSIKRHEPRLHDIFVELVGAEEERL